MPVNNTVFNCNSFGPFDVSRLKKKRFVDRQRNFIDTNFN